MYKILTILFILTISVVFFGCVTDESIPDRMVQDPQDNPNNDPKLTTSYFQKYYREEEEAGEMTNGIYDPGGTFGKPQIPEDVGTVPAEPESRIFIDAYLDKLQAYDCLQYENEEVDDNCTVGGGGGYMKTYEFADVFKFNTGEHCTFKEGKGISIHVTQNENNATTPEGFIGCIVYIIVYDEPPITPPLYGDSVALNTTYLGNPRPGMVTLQGEDCVPNKDYYVALYGLDINPAPQWESAGFPYNVEIVGH